LVLLTILIGRIMDIYDARRFYQSRA
jgi:hypothetical protein